MTQEDQGRPKKQRHTARRVYVRLLEEYRFSGSESSVRKCVQKLRGQVSEAFIPLESDAGKMGQLDVEVRWIRTIFLRNLG